MASRDKAELARAGTMETTSKEGKAYLEKNLTEWKKPLLIGKTVQDEVHDEAEDEDEQQPAAKKARFAKASTMEATAKEAKELLGNKKLGDTRQVTKSKQKASPKRVGTMAKSVAEAKAVFGDLDTGADRSMRKRKAAVASSPAKNTGKTTTAKKAKTSPKKKKVKPAAKKVVVKKATLKQARTMAATTQEAAQLLGKEALGDTRQVTKAKKASAAHAQSAKKGTKKRSK